MNKGTTKKYHTLFTSNAAFFGKLYFQKQIFNYVSKLNMSIKSRVLQLSMNI